MTDIDATIVQDKLPRNEPSFVVVDIGKKQKRKAIKGLRKGKGKLTRKIEEMLAELQETRALPDGSPLVVVVRQKKKKKRARLLGL